MAVKAARRLTKSSSGSSKSTSSSSSKPDVKKVTPSVFRNVRAVIKKRK